LQLAFLFISTFFVGYKKIAKGNLNIWFEEQKL
jgi:hypothetical protein